MYLFLFHAPAEVLAGSLTVELKQEAAIGSEVVQLSDVANLRGTEPGQVSKIAQIQLGPAPEFGLPAMVSRQQIQALIQASGITTSGVVFTGSDAVKMVRRGRLPDPAEITAALKNHIKETTPWEESEIEINFAENMGAIELPPGDVQLRLAPGATLAGRKKILSSIEVVQSGRVLRSFWITADISVRAKILTASRKISFNKTVDAEDIAVRIMEISDLRAAYARRPEDLIGKVARRGFAAGAPLIRDAFAEPFLVRHGDTVQLCLDRNGIVLRSLAKAEQDGRLGQVINVRNLEFSTPLKAQVTGRGEVRMQ